MHTKLVFELHNCLFSDSNEKLLRQIRQLEHERDSMSPVNQASLQDEDTRQWVRIERQTGVRHTFLSAVHIYIFCKYHQISFIC